MDKKSLLGLIIIGAILFGFSWYTSKQQTQLNKEKARVDSVANAGFKALGETALAAAPVDSAYNTQLETSLGTELYGSMNGTEEFYTIENNLMTVTLSNRGGRVASVVLKDYKRYNGEPLVLFDEKTSNFNLSFFTNQQINTGDFYFKAADPENISLKEGDTEGLFSLRLYSDSTSYVEYLYTIYPNSYMIDYKINFVGMENKLAKNQPDFAVKWESVGFQNEKGFSNENNYSTVAYMFPGDDSLEDLGMSSDAKKAKEETINTRMKWVAFKQQFFSSIFIAVDNFENGELKYETFEPASGKVKKYIAQLSIPFSPQSKSYAFNFYFGPNKFNILNDYEIGLQKLVPLGGWLIGWINRYIVIPTFDFLGNYFVNYGLIILLLTIFIKVITYPLTYKSYLSMAKMRVLKPELDTISAKFPDQKDAMKKQQATMELYRSAGVNPMGGCLPLLIQFPVLIAMFRFFPASIELRQQSFLWADDLSSYDSILNLPFDIPFYGSHVSLFTLLMAVSIFISSRMSYNQSANSAPQMAGMKFMMLYIMPLMMIFWFNNYSSGLSYYYLLSNVITIGQTVGFRYLINEDKLHKKLKETAKKPKKKSKFMQRYEDAIKQQQQQATNKK